MEMSLLSCPVCLKPHFQGVDALRSSLINVATTHISCPVCSELLLGLDKLTIHLFSHISGNKYSQDCSSQTNASNEVETNVSNELETKTASENTFNVPQDIEMTEKSDLDLCMEEKTEKTSVTCDICNFHFSDENILDLHQKLLHQTSPDKKTGRYHYHCHLCSKQFKMRGSLMVHLRVAHFGFIQSNHRKAKSSNVQDTSDQQEDAQMFVTPSQNHTEKRKVPNAAAKAQDNKQWECEVCLKLFTTKYFLKKHKRLHTGEMPYYCSQCNKYFTFQQSYHKHMLYHSDDKPHICTECGRAFKELSTLHNHERIHSGERPFSCETCGKCFRQRVSYLVHRRIHTGAMPYKCTACNKTFRYKVSQRSHKCPVSPPGCVIRTPDLVEKLIQKQKVNKTPDLLEQNADLEFHINRDQNARVDFSFVEQNLDVVDVQNYLQESNCVNKSSHSEGVAITQENNQNVSYSTDNSQTKGDVAISFTSTDTGNPDFFALILSPVLSDVQSLCLSSYTAQNEKKNENTSTNGEALQTINEESFKELLYGPK